MQIPTMSKEAVKSLQTLVRVGLALGVAASMAANIAFAIADSGSSTGWMVAIRVLFSAAMPLALFWCIDLIIRIPGTSRLRSVVRVLVTTGIGGFAGWVSYWHMHDILVLVGEPIGTARVVPGAIDGAMLVGTISMIELERTARNIAAVEQAQRNAAQAQAEIEAEAAKAQARADRQITAEEQAARDAVRYDRMNGTTKGKFTRVYRTEGADAAIRQFAGRRRSTATPAVKAADPLHPVSPGTVDTDRLNAGMAGATA